MRQRRTLGQLAPMTIASSVANVGVQAYANKRLNSLLSSFQKKLSTDAEQMDYIKNAVERIRSASERIASSGRYQPGTPSFEQLLKQSLANDMAYTGNCSADIYAPSILGVSGRSVWASIDRNGAVRQSNITPEVGLIWASGCGKAQEQAKIAFVKAYKGSQQFQAEKITTTDIGTRSLGSSYIIGMLFLVALILILKMQGAVIAEQI